MESLNLIGSKTIETEHFILRKFKGSDGEAMYRNWASNPNVARYVTWDVHESVEVSIGLCKFWEKESENNDKFNWVMELKETGEPIGSIEVVSLNKEINEATIGYCMGENWWSKGYMTECFKAVIEFLFNEVNINRISAEHHTHNPASGKVMKKSGLLFEGVKRQGGISKGELFDIASYGLLKSDYLKNL